MTWFTPIYADPGQALLLRISAIRGVYAGITGFTFRRFSDRNIIEIDVTGTARQIGSTATPPFEWEVPIAVRQSAQSGMCECLALSPPTPGGLAVLGAFWIRPAWAIATRLRAVPNEVVLGSTVDVRVSGVPNEATSPRFAFHTSEHDFSPAPSIRVNGHPVNEGGGTYRINVTTDASAPTGNVVLKVWLSGFAFIASTNVTINTAHAVRSVRRSRQARRPWRSRA